MNRSSTASATLIVVSLLSIGCENETATTPSVSTGTDTSATNAPSTQPMGIGNTADGRTNAENLRSIGQSVRNYSTEHADAAGQATADAGSGVVAQAQKLYADAEAAIAKMDFSGAQKHIDQLKGLSDKLPPEWKTRVDELGKRVAEMRAKAPGMPAMPQ